MNKVCLNCKYGYISDDHPFIACHNPESPDYKNGGCLLPDHTCVAWVEKEMIEYEIKM